MKNTYSHSHGREHGGRLDIIIGDDKQPLFYPQVKIQAWDNEANFSLRYVNLEPGKAVKEGGKLKLKGKHEVHAYPTTIDLKDEHRANRKDIDYSQYPYD